MDIKLIIGLGNNDPTYETTYHNVGFLFIDYFNKIESTLPVLKTKGYMNESGIEVKKMLKKYKIDPKNLLIIQDDSDIFIDDYKFSFDHGSAGHKGIQNIIDQIKTKEFWRLRIGIRPEPKTEGEPRKKAEDFVLKNISAINLKILNGVFEKSSAKIKNL